MTIGTNDEYGGILKAMSSFFKKCVFFLFTAVPVFSQTEARQQGIVTAEPFWRQALGGAVIALPHVQAGSAVVALDGGNIRAYSAAGTPMWNYSARGRVSPFVTRSREGTTYFSRTTGLLIAVNRAGRELWQRNIGSPLVSKVVVGWDGRLFVPTDKTILCYTASGTLLWTKTFDASFSIYPELDRGGGILFSLVNNEVYRIDPYGNTHGWVILNTPASLLSIEQNKILALYADGSMEILGSAEDWFMSASGDAHPSVLPSLPSMPLAAANDGNNIAAVLNDGRVMYVSIDERRIIWSGDSHIRELINRGSRPEGEVEIIFDERGIYVLNINGATCFSPDGDRLWFMLLQNAAAIPAIGDDGILYSGGRDWILYAYKIEDRIPQRNVLYGPVPEGSYGTGRPHPLYMTGFPLFEYEITERLEQIARAVSTGRIGSQEPYWTTFLLTISAGQESLINRLAAINLLGKIGSRETVPWLLNIFNRENEPLIRAAAVNAIGDIGVDPDGIAIRTFQYSIVLGGIRNDNVLVAIASATGAICRFSGPPLSEAGVQILTFLTAGNMPYAVRRQAAVELNSLR